MRLDTPQRHGQRRRAPGQGLRDPKHENGRALFRGNFQSTAERGCNALAADQPRLAEIQCYEREPWAAHQEIRRAPRRAGAAAALHPENSAKISTRCHGGAGIE
jgi:hypothetical protein